MTFSVQLWQPTGVLAPLRYGVLLPQGDATADEAVDSVLLFWPGLGGTVKNALGFFNRLLPTVQRIVVPDLQGFGLNDEHPLPPIRVHQQQALAFLNHVATQYPSANIIVGGISLGALLQASLITNNRTTADAFNRVVGQCWVAPAFKAHPKTFSIHYQLGSAVKALMGQRVKLPYGLSDLTRNPEVLANKQHQAHSDDFSLPMRYLLQIRPLGNKVRRQLVAQPAALPTLITIPGNDVVCCPRTMTQIAGHMAGNSPPNAVKLYAYNKMRHDMLLEPEMPEMAKAISDWMSTILLQK